MIRVIFKEGFAKVAGSRNIRRVHIGDNEHTYSFPGFVKKNERTNW